MSNKRPDIIWLVADQLHHHAVGYAGNDVIKTPNIDRLAAMGMAFETAYCQQPLCMPSRSSFNSGYYPHQTRVRNNPSQLPEDVLTLADRLKDVGYSTVAFGHIGGDGLESRFEKYADWWHSPLRQSVMAECDGILEGDALYPVHTRGEHPLPEDEMLDGVATGMAIDAIRDTQGPLFLELDFFAPHIPLFAPQKYIDMYKPEDIVLPEGWQEALADKPSSLRGARIATGMDGVDEVTLREALCHYYARISMIDNHVGRVLQALEERGDMDNTVIAFFSDHGDYAGQYGMIGKNRFVYDCLARVPLILATGKNLAGEAARVQSPVELVDVVPTCLELAGLEVAGDLPGHSLLQTSEKDDSKRPVFSSHLSAQGAPVSFSQEWGAGNLKPGPFDPYGSGSCQGDGCTMVRKGNYKLIVYKSGDMELFNLADDPGELHNLYGCEGHEATTQELLVELVTWQMRTTIPDTPQEGLPYHFRAFVRRRVPESFHKQWDEWQANAEREGI